MRPESEPPGWFTTTLESVADWASGGTPSRSNPAFFDGDIPWIKTGELGPKVIRHAEEKITPEAIKRSAAKVFPKGCVGIAMYGATIGKVSIWGIEASTNQACAVATPLPELLFNEFLYYYLLSQQRDFVNAGKGGAQPNISQGVLREWPICLPPITEQRRIVAKIEELFSELDKGIENLKQAKSQLAVYRQSILKHAFEGKLTADWRATHSSNTQTAKSYLTSLKCQKNNTAQFSSNSLHPIESWSFAVLDELTEYITSGSRGWAEFYSDSGSLFIRAQNLNRDRLDLTEIAYVQLPNNAEGKRTQTRTGDLFITITGANVTKAGFLNRDIGEAYVSQHVALCRPLDISLSEYLYLYIISDGGGRKDLEHAAYGAGKPGLNLDNIRSLEIPIPPPDEIPLIVAEIKSSVAAVEALEADIDINLKKAEVLRQSILKKAFAGELVPQDPTDEPADALLARIRAERSDAAKSPPAAKPSPRRRKEP